VSHEIVFEKLPVWHGISSKYIQPQYAPFKISLNQLGLIAQESESMSHITSYESDEYSWITPPPGKSKWANSLGDMYYDYIASCIQEFKKQNGHNPRNIIEIGAGTTHIAEKVCQHFDNVSYTIVDPSVKDVPKSQKINIIKEYFTDSLHTPIEYDFCISLNALEHVLNPVQFLKKLSRVLTNNAQGSFVFPNVYHQFKMGDINALLHEHVSYFTDNSIKNAFLGSQLEILQLSNREDTAYVYFKKNLATQVPEHNWQHEAKFLQDSAKLFNQNFLYFNDKVQSLLSDGKNIAFYGATNGLNNLLVLSNLHTNQNIRVVDSDEFKHGKFISGCSNAICSPEIFATTEFDFIFVSALSFYQPIKQFLMQKYNIPEAKILKVTKE
jgi:2-polyprenyl-3-methyl-5-hydroxy-6-metoxy-1,4-benzoquinol methylase